MDELPILHWPPFPPMRFCWRFWEFDEFFPAWAGFPTLPRPFAPSDEPALSDGRAEVLVLPPGPFEAGRLPTPEQAVAYANLKAHEAATAEPIRAAAVAYQTRAGHPPPSGDLRGKIRFNPAVILPVARDGEAYVGLEVGCFWTNDGCSVILHGARVVGAGRFDVTEDYEMVTQDGGAFLE